LGLQKTRDEKTFTVIRGRFTISEIKKVTINVLGLGFFKCYINGICINPDTFLPLSSDYEPSCDSVKQMPYCLQSGLLAQNRCSPSNIGFYNGVS
jgi:hypothetical protein